MIRKHGAARGQLAATSRLRHAGDFSFARTRRSSSARAATAVIASDCPLDRGKATYSIRHENELSGI